MFTRLESFLQGKKTHIIAFLMVVIAVVNYITGDLALVDLVGDPNLQLFLNGLGLSALRAGVDKVK